MKNPETFAPNIHIDAIDAGRYQTFTQPLGEGRIGTFGSAAQKVIAKIPILRFIAPFVRTPVNIVKFASERTPAGFMTTKYKNAIAEGSSRYCKGKIGIR